MLPFVVSGLALGAVYALSAVGIVVLYRATGVLNLAYGAVGAIGALLSWQLLQDDWPVVPALLAAPLLSALLSGLYGALISPLVAARDPLVKAVCTLGYALMLLGTCFWLWSDDARTLTLPTDIAGFDLGTARVTLTQALALGLAVTLTVGTAALLRWTAFGTAMRALADDREISALLGVRIRRVETLTWVAGGAIAGLTGLVLGSLTRLEAGTLTFLVIASLAAAVVGRFRSLSVTLVAGLAIGLVEAIGAAWPETAPYRSVAPFAVAVVVILWLQRTGARARRGGTVEVRSAERPVGALTRPLPPGDARSVLRVLGGLVAGAAALAVLVPLVADGYWVRVLTSAVIFTIPAAGIALLYGRLGLVSLGQVALLGVGGWVALRLAFATGWPFPLVVLAAGAVTCLVGIIYGLPALRLSGVDLALVTLMAGGAFQIAFSATGFPDGGPGFLGKVAGSGMQQAMPRPSMAISDAAFFRVALVCAVLALILVVLHQRGRPGRAWAAIRSGEAGALAVGVALTRYKVWAFALAAFITGTAGALLAANTGRLDPISFKASDSVLLFAVVLIGGAYGLTGVVLAGVVGQVVPAALDAVGINGNLMLVVFGAGTVHALVTAPRGIGGQLEDLAGRWR
ncbi:ABC transporter permease [Spongiactinospora sp. TRM90649]|uniref:ABC transporter permease n=1 Tax=Spongiactinospora sp. TRM90649 TaxID=3031114 RepID=UPI0023F64EFA|nr:ABC transporter permease [Spongiactinospora sp. TRM90649]MDF5756282.1 ABC transporter permease [Spongiactinospora sp. TRM90649]